MAVPTPTSQFKDLTVATLIPNGSPSITDDQHCTNVTYAFDGVNDFLSSALTPFSASSGSKHSLTFWMNVTDPTPAVNFSTVEMADVAGLSNGLWYLALQTTGRLECSFMSNGLTARVKSQISDAASIGWNHIGLTVDGNDLNIYMGGSEGTYVINSQVIGGGFTGVKSGSLTPLSVGKGLNGVSDTIFSRLKFWEGTTLTSAQILEEFNAETNLIGTCDIGGGPIGIFPSAYEERLLDSASDSLFT